MKKRMIAALSSAAILCGIFSIPAYAAETKYEMGDVNMDGVVDLKDVLDEFTEYNYQVAELGHFLTSEQLELARLYGGEEVTLDDVIILLTYSNLKNIAKLPEEIIGKNVMEFIEKGKE